MPTVCQLRWAGACVWLVLHAFARCAQACNVHVGADRLSYVDCPSFDDIRIRHSGLEYDGHWAMRLCKWHPHQKGVVFCLLQMQDRMEQLLT